MRKFIVGLLCGVILCIGIAVGESFVAETPTFDVFVNGEKFYSDPPTLVVNGRTYLPLRAMGDALGVPVNWNEEKGQVEVGTPPAEEDQPNMSWCYEENPAVPDFGYVVNRELDETEMRDNNIVSKCYAYGSNASRMDSDIQTYIEVLKQNGYILNSKDKNTITYINYSKKTMVAILDARIAGDSMGSCYIAFNLPL